MLEFLVDTRLYGVLGLVLGFYLGHRWRQHFSNDRIPFLLIIPFAVCMGIIYMVRDWLVKEPITDGITLFWVWVVLCIPITIGTASLVLFIYSGAYYYLKKAKVFEPDADLAPKEPAPTIPPPPAPLSAQSTVDDRINALLDRNKR